MCDKTIEGLVFSVAGTGDVPELIEFLAEEYFNRFPPADILHLEVEKEVRPWLGEYVANVVSKDCSILVRDPAHSNRIAAAAVNDIICEDRPKEDIGLLSFNDPDRCPNWAKYCQLLDVLYTDVKFDRYPVLSLDLMTVGRDYEVIFVFLVIEFIVVIELLRIASMTQGHGLASECVSATIRQAQQRNIDMIKAEAFNQFMAKALNKVGFDLVKAVNYNFYVNRSGEKPYSTDSIHNKAQIFVINAGKAENLGANKQQRPVWNFKPLDLTVFSSNTLVLIFTV